MSVKTRIINAVFQLEGGYVNNPNDSGGETNYGITESVARSNGYQGPMAEMPQDVAVKIYEKNYWDALKCDELLNLSEMITREIFDIGVNLGVGRAAKFLQRCLNVLNQQGSLYKNLLVDGLIGNQTIKALESYLVIRDEQTLCKGLNALKGAFYLELAEKREKDQEFIYGWLKNRVV